MDVRRYFKFADLIRSIRQEHRLSQRGLAKRLGISAGYVGQWELGLSQPSPEVVLKLCHTFDLADTEYVQRLAYASRAPHWLQDSIVHYQPEQADMVRLTPDEKRVLTTVRRLPERHVGKLADRAEAWVDGWLAGSQGTSG